MEASLSSDPAKPIFSEEQLGDWTPRVPPRAVSSLEHESDLLLLPGRPASRLISRTGQGSGWAIKADDLPAWATDAVYQNGSLLLVGAVDGEIYFESRAIAL